MESNGQQHGALSSNAAQHSSNFRIGVELQCVTERDNEQGKNNMDATKERDQRRQHLRIKIMCNGKGTHASRK